jgi:hypothetical protein
MFVGQLDVNCQRFLTLGEIPARVRGVLTDEAGLKIGSLAREQMLTMVTFCSGHANAIIEKRRSITDNKQ